MAATVAGLLRVLVKHINEPLFIETDNVVLEKVRVSMLAAGAVHVKLNRHAYATLAIVVHPFYN